MMSVLTKDFYTVPGFKSYGTVSFKVGQKVDLARGKKGKMGILDCIMILLIEAKTSLIKLSPEDKSENEEDIVCSIGNVCVYYFFGKSDFRLKPLSVFFSNPDLK